MALIGYLGKSAEEGIIFTASDDLIETVSNMTWSSSARYATHQRHNTNALTEFTGLDPDKISFDITLAAELGVNPTDEITRIWTYQREGTALQFLLGEHAYGRYRWNITSHKSKITHTDVYGNIYWAVVNVSLQEYLSK